MSKICSVSVIIPVFHEESTINSAIRALRTHQPVVLREIIVVDGSPGGETLAALEDEGVKRVLSSKGRGCQMNEGARHATGEILLFLHADTTLPPGGLERLASAMDTGAFVGGAFDLAIDSEALSMKLIARAACARSRFTRLPYGDQALFFEREHFWTMGGFGDIPIMEDVDLMRRIKKTAGRICILPEKVSTSPRRWEEEGVVYCTLRNWVLVTLYFLGVSPDKLASFYRDASNRRR